MNLKDALIKNMLEYGNVDISDSFESWFEYLCKFDIICDSNKLEEYELAHLKSHKEQYKEEYWNECAEEWYLQLFIDRDEDVNYLGKYKNNSYYFIHNQKCIEHDIIENFYNNEYIRCKNIEREKEAIDICKKMKETEIIGSFEERDMKLIVHPKRRAYVDIIYDIFEQELEYGVFINLNKNGINDILIKLEEYINADGFIKKYMR